MDLKENRSLHKIDFIIANKPLTDRNWEKFKKSKLITFKNGEMIYSNYRKIMI